MRCLGPVEIFKIKRRNLRKKWAAQKHFLQNLNEQTKEHHWFSNGCTDLKKKIVKMKWWDPEMWYYCIVLPKK